MSHRIALIHAVRVAIDPIERTFKQLWPEAQPFNLLDDALSPDLERAGEITPALIDRFVQLSQYSLKAGAEAILFTCSAFGSAIDVVKAQASVPVLKPNEAMIEDALAAGTQLALVATFAPTLSSMKPEIEAMAGDVTVQTVHVPGALEALQSEKPEAHDALIADAAASLTGFDAVLLAQFSMGRAASKVRERTAARVLTSPESAVLKLRKLLAA